MRPILPKNTKERSAHLVLNGWIKMCDTEHFVFETTNYVYFVKRYVYFNIELNFNTCWGYLKPFDLFFNDFVKIK